MQGMRAVTSRFLETDNIGKKLNNNQLGRGGWWGKHGDLEWLGQAFDLVLNVVLVMTSSFPLTTTIPPNTFNPLFSPHNHFTATFTTNKIATHCKNVSPKQETGLTSQWRNMYGMVSMPKVAWGITTP